MKNETKDLLTNENINWSVGLASERVVRNAEDSNSVPNRIDESGDVQRKVNPRRGLPMQGAIYGWP